MPLVDASNWVERLPEMAGAGVIKPETVRLVEPTYGEAVDPETGDVVLTVHNPLPQQMTAAEAQQAQTQGLIAPQRAQEIAAGIEPERFDDSPQGVAVPFAQQGAQTATQGPFRSGAATGRIDARRRAAEQEADAAEREMASAYGAEADAIADQAEVQARRAAERESYLEQRNAEMARIDTRDAAQENHRQEQVEAAMAEMDQAEEDARYKIAPDQRRHHQSVLDSRFTTPEQKRRARLALESAQRVDPDAIFGPAGSGERMARKLIAAIAVGVGAFAASVKGGPNRAMQIIDKQIDRSIAEQRAAFQRNERSYRARRQGYTDLMAQFKDQRMAEAVARNRMINDTQRYIDQMALRHGDEEIQAKADILNAQLEQRKLANRDVYRRHAEARADRLFAAAEQKRSMAAARAAKGAAQRLGPQEISGLQWTGQEVTKDDIKQVKKIWGAGQAGLTAVDRAIELREEHGGEAFGAVAAEMDILRDDLVNVIKEMAKAGALGDKEREHFQSMVGDISGHFSIDQVERLKALRQMMERKLTGELSARGYQRRGKGPSVEEAEAAAGVVRD